VTKEDIVDEGLAENNYSRGLVVAGDIPGPERIIAYLNPDNTGITGTAAIEPDITPIDGSNQNDNNTTASDARIEENPHSDFITVTVDSSASTFGISGSVTFCGANGQAKNRLKDNANSSITAEGVSCGNLIRSGNDYSYSCDVTPNSSTTLLVTNSYYSTSASQNFDTSTSGYTPVDIQICTTGNTITNNSTP